MRFFFLSYDTSVQNSIDNSICCSGNGADITIGTEMIGQSIQCSANNGLFSDGEMPISQAVQIDPYSKLYMFF